MNRSCQFLAAAGMRRWRRREVVLMSPWRPHGVHVRDVKDRPTNQLATTFLLVAAWWRLVRLDWRRERLSPIVDNNVLPPRGYGVHYRALWGDLLEEHEGGSS